MPGSPLAAPDEVVDLARRRDAARRDRDYAAADELRDAISAAGWKVSDSPAGFVLLPLRPAVEVYPKVAAVPSAAGEPDSCQHSVCIAYHGWPEDVARLVNGFSAGAPAGSLEVLLGVADGAEDPPPDLLGSAHQSLARQVRAVRVTGAGQAQAYNAVVRCATGRIVHLVEPSLEFGFDVLQVAAASLGDPAVGACGPFGLDTADWREFQPAAGPQVMALEYLLSLRRADAGRIGEMDPGFRYYRNLDLDFSRQVAATGMELRTYPAVVQRHLHRLWDSTSAEDRDRLSRRNFNRMLDRWVRPGVAGSAAPPPA